jgi:YHS domain-containing protein
MSRTTVLPGKTSFRKIEGGSMARDPVCNMEVNEQNAPAQTRYQGQNYYFCSEQCKQKFDQNPQQFAKKSA